MIVVYKCIEVDEKSPIFRFLKVLSPKYMKIRFTFIIALLIGSTFWLSAQNTHYSYFQMAPLDINPANIGDFQGSIRVGGIFRQQAFNVDGPGSNYNGSNFYLDANLLNGLTDGDWISFGLSVDAFSSGAAGFKRTYMKPGASYHFAYGKKKTQILTLGVQYGTVSDAYNFGGDDITTGASLVEGRSFDAQIDLGASIANGLMENRISSSASELIVGLTYKSKFGNKNASHFLAGASIGNLLNPRLSIGVDNSFRISKLIHSFVQFRLSGGGNVVFTPTIFYQRQGQASELQFNALLDYTLNKKSKTPLTLRGGLGARLANASDAQVLAGADYKNFRVGMSFDLGVSGTMNVDNAYEIALSYIYNIFKKPKVKPIIICPGL